MYAVGGLFVLKGKVTSKAGAPALQFLRPAGIGVFAGCLVVAILLYLVAALITWRRSIPEELLNGLTTAILCIGSLTGGGTAAAVSGARGLVYGAVTGAALALIVLLIGASAYSFQYTALIAVKAGMMVLCGMIAGICTVNRKRKVRY